MDQTKKQKTASNTTNHSSGTSNVSSVDNTVNCNNKYNYMIITPAVSIDRNYNNDNAQYYIDEQNINQIAQNQCIYNNNNNYNSDNSINNNDQELYQNQMPICEKSTAEITNRTNLMPKRTIRSTTTASSTKSWRWCTLICSAIRCLGTGLSASVAVSSTTYTNGNHTNINSINNNIARNFITTDNHCLDLIVSNTESPYKSQNSPHEL